MQIIRINIIGKVFFFKIYLNFLIYLPWQPVVSLSGRIDWYFTSGSIMSWVIYKNIRSECLEWYTRIYVQNYVTMDRSNNRLKFTTAYLSSVYVISFYFLGFECASSTACIAYKNFMTIIDKTWVVLFHI